MDPVAPANPAVSAAPPSAPAAPPAVSAAPPAAGSVAAPPAASLEDNVGFRQLREQYEATKAEAERWKKLGDYDQVSKLHGTHAQRVTEAIRMGRALGFTEDKIQEAMLDDPKGTLLYLQQEYAKPAATTRADLDRQLKEMLEQQVAPIREQFDEGVNREANALYEKERDRLYTQEFGDKLPDENKEELFEILDSLVSADQAALSRLKFQHQVSDIKRHMDQAKTVFLKRHNSYIAHERGRAPQNGIAKPSNGKDQSGTKYADRELSFGGKVKDLLNI